MTEAAAIGSARAAGGAAALGGVRGYGLLLALCLVLFLPGLFTIPPFDRDESRFAQASRQMLESGNFIDIRFQDQARHKKPIGIYWLQAASASLFGGDHAPIWAYRLPSLAGAVAAVLLTAWLGARMFGTAAGLIAGAMLASTVLLGVEARMAKTDAALLACIVAAQAVLARAYLAGPVRDGPDRLSWPEALLFWGAIGVGGLIKGPIIVLVVGGTVLMLVVQERRGRWLRRLRPLAGSGLVLAIVLPWLIAITLETRGAFFDESVGQDLLGKIFDAQEAHGAPPGYYLVAFWATFWPWSLVAALAAPWVWARRRQPEVRFALAWIVPTWVLYELVMTKLPHYVLPAYPAVALLAAAAALDGFGWGAERRRLWPWLGPVVAWAVPTLGLTLGAVALPLVLGQALDPVAVVVAGVALGAFGFGLRRLWPRPGSGQGQIRLGLAALGVGAVATIALAFGRVLPGLDPVWLSPRIATAVAAVRPCPDSVVAAAGYHEPSMVFLLGTDTHLVDGAAAARHVLDDRCGLALIGTNDEAAFTATLAGAGAAPALLATVTGFNYSSGRLMTLHLYGPPPRHGA